MSGGVSGGHFVGFFLAVLGFAALVVVFSRPNVVKKLGSMRWPAAIIASVFLLLVAIFGSGKREITFHTLAGPGASVISRISQAHVDAALARVTEPEFVQSIARLDGGAPVDQPERLATSLSIEVGTTVDLNAKGYRLDPPPKIGQTWLFVTYLDRENALIAALRGGDATRRLVIAEMIATKVVPQAAAIEALRMAKTDEERLDVLRENPFVMPYAAEWLAAELKKLEQGASPRMAAEIAKKRAYVQKYVDNSTSGIESGAVAP